MTQHIVLKELILVESEIILFGTVQVGYLSYDTSLHVSSKYLNRILNQLQARNPEVSVGEGFLSTPIDAQTTAFVLNASELSDATCYLHWEELERSLVQVRA
jgi:hypothetical protein